MTPGILSNHNRNLPNNPAALHAAVAAWYAANARDLPWRHTQDPYSILVSEIMLQQTQVDRTIPKYRQFLEAFPTIHALAAAAPGDVIRVWSGMGYNGRAVRLHKLAQTVVSEHNGELPRTVDELRKLPGIGPYTAAAVACFAFGAPVPVIDTNIYRVLSRVVHGVEAPERRNIDPLVASLVPGPEAPLDSSTWHQALMDIGATLCTAARPRCMLCPLREHCASAPLLQDGSAPHLAEASVPYVPKQSKFAGSTRFYRGRIVDALRALPNGQTLSLGDLTSLVDDGAGPAQGVEWIATLVDALVRDGLVRRDGNQIALP